MVIGKLLSEQLFELGASIELLPASKLQSDLSSRCSDIRREFARQERASKIIERRKKAHNNARDAICPHSDRWTIIDSDGSVMYTIHACINQGKRAPVA